MSGVPKIECPKCKSKHSKVIDVRPSDEGVARRRKCQCGYTYNTLETYQRYVSFLKKADRHNI